MLIPNPSPIASGPAAGARTERTVAGCVEATFVSRDSKAFLQTVRRCAQDRSHSLLIRGETGAGKEIIARYVHERGGGSGDFVAINCAALVDTLVESELFGYKKGAFSGATQDKPGAFTQAHGGTLFLDEIHRLPLDTQGKLLRAAQERRIRPLGATADEPVDVKLIAATNVDLADAVREGRLLRDLYERFLLEVEVPPLRDRARGEDFDALCRVLLDRLGGARLTARAKERLLAEPHWAGNVRQLERVLTQAALAAAGASKIGKLRIDEALRRPDPHPEQLAAIALIRHGRRVLLVSSSWEKLFFLAARYKRGMDGNAQAALLRRLREEVEIGEADVTLGPPEDFDLLQTSERDGQRKLYHFRVFRVARLRWSPEEFERHVFARARCAWWTPGEGRHGLSPTVGRLLNAICISEPPNPSAETARGKTFHEWLEALPQTEFGGTIPSEPPGSFADACARVVRMARDSNWTYCDVDQTMTKAFYDEVVRRQPGILKKDIAAAFGKGDKRLMERLEAEGVAPVSPRRKKPPAGPKRRRKGAPSGTTSDLVGAHKD